MKSEDKNNKKKSRNSELVSASAVAVNFTLHSPLSALRIVDANLNRCREGLRVVEDVLRYIFDDAVLYKKIRSVRHNTDKILRDKYASLISSRDSVSDAGRKIPETLKKDLPGIVAANFKRAQESLRVLEEYSKAVYPKASAEFKKQRYSLYQIEKKTLRYLPYCI